MLYITKCGFRETASPETMKEMVATFVERGPSPGETAHYLRFGGGGGRTAV